MAIRAENDPRYSRRFLIMGIVAAGFAVWCLYDGLFTFPNQRQRALAYHKLETESKDQDPKVFLDRWHEIAQQNNWSATYPGEPKDKAEIVTQFILFVVSGVAGLMLLSIPLRSRGRWIEMDDSGLRSSWGQAFHFDQVELLNKRKWRDKGIAKITYRDGMRKRRFILDDFKFMRDPTDAILFELEQRIGIEKITGGPLEPLVEDHVDDPTDIATPTSADNPS